MNREYVGIDLHRRRSVIVRKNSDGEVLSKVHIDNDPVALAEAVGTAGPEPEVVVEATFGWYWAAMCWPRWAPMCIWPIRWGTTGATAE